MKKVLIVDDREENRVVLKNFFNFFGKRDDIEIFMAESSEEAFNIAVKEKPLLIFLDVQIETRTSGMEVAKKIRENLPNDKIVIWAVTAQTIKNYSDIDSIEEQCIKSGCNKYFTKPFDQKKMIVEVAEILDIPIPEFTKEKMGI